MAAVAIEEVEFREHALGPAPGVGEEGERAVERHRLAHRPHLHRVGPALASGIVAILIVMLLQGREEVELEGDAWVPRGHDAMADELARIGRAEMAVETDAGARLRVVERDHAARHVGGVARADGVMAG